MSVTILVCPCGSRLKAAGMAPGKSGRCPSCGRMLRMPEETPAAPAVSDEDVCAILKAPEPEPPPVEEEDEWNWKGTYELDPTEPPRPTIGRTAATAQTNALWEPWPESPQEIEEQEAPEQAEPPPPAEPPADTAAADGEWDWTGMYDLGATAPPPAPVPAPAPGPAEPPPALGNSEVLPAPAPVGWEAKDTDAAETANPDPWWPPRLLYPLRGAEGLMMVAVLGGIAWVFGTLVPEYCLGIMADAELLGASSMGHLVILISALPVMVLGPLGLIYGLQYLARVLVAASEGEPRPPRPPDRNADGLLNGMDAWLLWLVLGVTVALLPLTVYVLVAASRDLPVNPVLAGALGLVGLPYALLALMMTFLHDDALAARPSAVLGTLARLFPSFLALSLTIVALAALGAGYFVAMFLLRRAAFWVYIPVSLSSWTFAVWLAIVAMHTLGAYYTPRKKQLKWRRKRLRWGAK